MSTCEYHPQQLYPTGVVRPTVQTLQGASGSPMNASNKGTAPGWDAREVRSFMKTNHVGCLKKHLLLNGWKHICFNGWYMVDIRLIYGWFLENICFWTVENIWWIYDIRLIYGWCFLMLFLDGTLPVVSALKVTSGRIAAGLNGKSFFNSHGKSWPVSL